MTFSIRKKVLLCGYLPLLLALAIGGVALWNLDLMKRTQDWVDHTQNVLRKASDIVAAAVNMETGMRGYLLAGDEVFLEPYNAGLAEFDLLIAELSETVSDNPPQVERLAEAATVLATWRAEIVDPRIALRREIGNAETMNDMADLVGEGRGKAYFDSFRAMIAEFIATEQALLQQREAAFTLGLLSGDISIETVTNAWAWVAHTNAVILEAQMILAAAIDMETGMRGYLLAGQEQFLEPYNWGTERFLEQIEALAATVEDNPPQVALILEARDTIVAWETDVVAPMIDLRRTIGDAATMDDLSDIVRRAEGKVYFDQFRQIMADFAAEEEALMIDRQAENEVTRQRTILLISAAMAVALVVGVGSSTLIGRNIGGALTKLTGAMRALADGKNDTQVPMQGRRDELGDMANATEVFKQNALRIASLNEAREVERRQQSAVLSEVGDALQALSLGQLGRRLQDDLGADYDALVTDFNLAMQSLEDLVRAIGGSATSVNGSIQAIAQSNDGLARRTTESAGSIQRTNEAVSGFASSVHNTSQNVDEVDGLIKNARSHAGTAEVLVKDMIASVERIDGRATEIATITSVISDIAFQTNLLALNAGVEAARAGPSGAGFAVVASEVRALAQRTSEAAKEIEGLVAASSHETGEGVRIVGETAEALQKIVSEVERVSKNMGQIAQDARSQAEGLGQIQSTLETLEQSAQSNAAEIEEATAATQGVSEDAAGLQKLVAQFALEAPAQPPAAEAA